MSDPMLGIVALGILFVAIFVGFPIAFILIFLSLIFGYIGFGDRAFDLMMLQFYGSIKDPLFVAVPCFLLMGYLMEQAGLMERMFRGFQLLLASVKGSLYLAVLVTATIFGAATGIVGSSVTILGIMAGPSMRKSGYDTRLSAGAITAGGTLGILIPPSIMLVIMGPTIGVPTTELFAAAVFPGLLLSAFYTIYCMVRCHFQPELGPPLPLEERASSAREVYRELFVGVVPVAVLILAVLGSILAGLATTTEAAGVGAFGALVLTIAYRRMTWKRLKEALSQTILVTGMVLFMVAASNLFGALFSRLGSAGMITEAVLGLSLPPLVMILSVLVLVFILGWPLEWLPIVIIVMPIVCPVVRKLGFDLVWFGTVIAVTLQTAWLSPPVALSAYFLKAVVPEWDLQDIYMGMMQFLGLQFLGAFVVVFVPPLSLWLPTVLFR